MITLQFKCTLLSDVILSQKAATEGSQDTLSFIPGNNFLGIVAKNYVQFTLEEQVEIFHSGKVRFGDAHPVTKDFQTRSLHIPASLFYPKLKSLGEESYVHHFYHRSDDHNGREGLPLQLKQSREGFYEFINNHEAIVIDSVKSFALKSSYDRNLRRSKDSQMFGYESLEKGSEYLFSVEIDNESLAQTIEEGLVGIKHIGRSRTAQYGLVEISKKDFHEQASLPVTFSMDGNTYITVYADGRLIFLDETGMPTFRPTTAMLGLKGEIIWEKSQVRTFQYAPWNGKRQTRDSDRVGFEKGSVFVVKLNQMPHASSLPSYIGSYQNEGFGKVIYGWELLQKSGENGLTGLKVIKKEKVDVLPNSPLSGTPLLTFLDKKQKQANASAFIYKQVNQFVNDNKSKFASKSFASQWGAIRTIALQHRTADSLLYELYDKKQTQQRYATPTDSRTEREESWGYITHGIKSKDWEKNHRGDILRKFIEAMGNSQYGDLSQRALVNLASEMAKQK